MSTVGWVVLTNDIEDGPPKWQPDWDGEVHTDKDRADAELAACRAVGYECLLGEVLASSPAEPDCRDIRSPALNRVAAAGWESYRRYMMGCAERPGRFLLRPWDKLSEDEQFAWTEAAKSIQAPLL